MTLHTFLWSLIVINFVLSIGNGLLIRFNRKLNKQLSEIIDQFNKTTGSKNNASNNQSRS